MSNLKDQYTHVSQLKGTLEELAEPPTDEGVAGLDGSGQMYYDTTVPAVSIHSGDNVWKAVGLTTTSTSTTTT